MSSWLLAPGSTPKAISKSTSGPTHTCHSRPYKYLEAASTWSCSLLLTLAFACFEGLSMLRLRPPNLCWPSPQIRSHKALFLLLFSEEPHLLPHPHLTPKPRVDDQDSL